MVVTAKFPSSESKRPVRDFEISDRDPGLFVGVLTEVLLASCQESGSTFGCPGQELQSADRTGPADDRRDWIAVVLHGRDSLRMHKLQPKQNRTIEIDSS